MTRYYFGTDGIRGRVGDSIINPHFFQRLGSAVATVLQQHNINNVIIGRDTRESGIELQDALALGLTQYGINVELLGVLPTPAVAYLTRQQKNTVGAMITASHNLFQDNGIKFFDRDGMKLCDADEQLIAQEIDQLSQTPSAQPGKITHVSTAMQSYMQFCKQLSSKPVSLQGLNCVVDCANGATYQIAPQIFSDLGAQVTAIAVNPDGKNINQDCGSTHIDHLQTAVQQQQADVGIAFDGDGDRLMMVDHLGNVVDGDQMLCVLARQAAGNNALPGVVGTVMSNLGLEQAMQAAGIAFERAKVGDRYVLEMLKKRNWFLGGEASGHIVDLHHTTTGDGIVTALQILQIMVQQKKSLHDLTTAMVKRPQVLINVPAISHGVDLQQYPKISEAVKQVEVALADRGRVLLRPSGTEACVRVMVEGNDKHEVLQTAERLADFVKHQLAEGST